MIWSAASQLFSIASDLDTASAYDGGKSAGGGIAGSGMLSGMGIPGSGMPRGWGMPNGGGIADDCGRGNSSIGAAKK